MWRSPGKSIFSEVCLSEFKATVYGWNRVPMDVHELIIKPATDLCYKWHYRKHHQEVAEKNMELLNMEHTSWFQISLNLYCLDFDCWESIFGDNLYLIFLCADFDSKYYTE